MRLLHAASKTHAAFDDVNLVSCAGLVPVMRLAARCGLAGLSGENVSVDHRCGANPDLKIASIVAGMVAGADSIDDLDVIRHGGMGRLFGGLRAPSTLGSFLRALSWGNACQIEKVARGLLPRLARHTALLPGAATLAFVDVDSSQKRVFGPAKQGAGYGHAKIDSKTVLLRGLNPLIATVSTPAAAPVVAGTRLRGGTTGSARGAASFITEAIAVARAAGATGELIVRADSAFYAGGFITAVRRAGARFSVTVRIDRKVRAAIDGIDEDAWTPIRYPNAIFDPASRRWVSDAEVAEVPYTAFASKKHHTVTARLIVRRVRDLATQDELFPLWRHHAVFTDNPHQLLTAESEHRDHAIIEQIFADLYHGPLAHLPSGNFAANAAWLSLAATCHNLLRAAGTLASAFHARARGATLRRHLITIPARLARRGRGHIHLHLPSEWPWQDAFTRVLDATHRGPPTTAA